VFPIPVSLPFPEIKNKSIKQARRSEILTDFSQFIYPAYRRPSPRADARGRPTREPSRHSGGGVLPPPSALGGLILTPAKSGHYPNLPFLPRRDVADAAAIFPQ
jgi:hypothetical protein